MRPLPICKIIRNWLEKLPYIPLKTRKNKNFCLPKKKKNKLWEEMVHFHLPHQKINVRSIATPSIFLTIIKIYATYDLQFLSAISTNSVKHCLTAVYHKSMFFIYMLFYSIHKFAGYMEQPVTDTAFQMIMLCTMSVFSLTDKLITGTLPFFYCVLSYNSLFHQIFQISVYS